MDERKIPTPTRPPWVIHAVAWCYIVPALIMGYALLVFRDMRPPLLSAFVLIAIPALFAGINVWALYRPNRLNRWIPLITATIGIIGLVLVQMLIVPMHPPIEMATYVLSIAIVYESAVFALSTVTGALLLLACPPARRHVFRRDP